MYDSSTNTVKIVWDYPNFNVGPHVPLEHVCKQAYTHVYSFKSGQTSYTKLTMLKCSDHTCTKTDPLMVDKQCKTLPRFY